MEIICVDFMCLNLVHLPFHVLLVLTIINYSHVG